jgi:hypothetical protein
MRWRRMRTCRLRRVRTRVGASPSMSASPSGTRTACARLVMHSKSASRWSAMIQRDRWWVAGWPRGYRNGSRNRGSARSSGLRLSTRTSALLAYFLSLLFFFSPQTSILFLSPLQFSNFLHLARWLHDFTKGCTDTWMWWDGIGIGVLEAFSGVSLLHCITRIEGVQTYGSSVQWANTRAVYILGPAIETFYTPMDFSRSQEACPYQGLGSNWELTSVSVETAASPKNLKEVPIMVVVRCLIHADYVTQASNADAWRGTSSKDSGLNTSGKAFCPICPILWSRSRRYVPQYSVWNPILPIPDWNTGWRLDHLPKLILVSCNRLTVVPLGWRRPGHIDVRRRLFGIRPYLKFDIRHTLEGWVGISAHVFSGVDIVLDINIALCSRQPPLETQIHVLAELRRAKAVSPFGNIRCSSHTIKLWDVNDFQHSVKLTWVKLDMKKGAVDYPKWWEGDMWTWEDAHGSWYFKLIIWCFSQYLSAEGKLLSSARRHSKLRGQTMYKSISWVFYHAN